MEWNQYATKFIDNHLLLYIELTCLVLLDIRLYEAFLEIVFAAAASCGDYDAMKMALAKGDENTLLSWDHFGNHVLYYAVLANPSLKTPLLITPEL